MNVLQRLYIVPRTVEPVEVPEGMREGWQRYSEVLRSLGVQPSIEIQLAYVAGWARDS